MKKHQKEAILLSFLKEKEKYKRLAEFIVHLIEDDPSAPKESLHTIIYRIKDESRLIEKIDMLNNKAERAEHPVTEKNYQKRVCDLLGVRIICLRLSDVGVIQEYLKLLSEENIIRFVKGPEQKNTFVLPFAPGESIPNDTELRYTGYSSIHCTIQLGENSGAAQDLQNLHAELQLRTILEEAWSEIDHKYRYVRSRSGIQLPEHIHTGFYNLSAFLQVAALQAEYLCRSAETYNSSQHPVIKINTQSNGVSGKAVAKEENSRTISLTEITKDLEESLGIEVSLRTMMYIEKRLRELNFEGTPIKTLKQLFVKNRLLEFKTVFQEILTIKPFLSANDRSIDVINALNFAISYELQGKRIAQEGLRVVLRWRKDRLAR
jgi:ppGpp synthetase/RelA/SpoT-type nucleotidyltranferase